ncbi:MAG: sulfotransferase [Alphaproteobacteria bacterium]|nr:sulfotransferase [Alphaproteobacteria bacterium]
MSNQQTYRQVADHMAAKNYGAAKELLDSHLANHPHDEIANSLYGTMLLQSGDEKAALERFEANAQSFLQSYAAQADLAFAARKLGRLEQAKDSFQKAIKLEPRFYPGWVFLSQTAFELQDYDLARTADEESEKHDPLDAEYPKMQAAMRAGNPAEAEKIARSMLQRQPGHPRAAFMLAHLASTVGAHEDRADILRHGLEHHPANQMLRRSRVEAFEAVGRHREALDEANILVAVAPNYFNYWTLSRICGHVADYEGALEAADIARTHLPEGSTEAGKLDLLRGHALKILGRRDECEQAYRACIVNTPDNGAGWWGLADLKNYPFSGDDKAEMAKLADRTDAQAEQRCQAAFALARALENEGDLKTAFGWYKKANDLREDDSYDAEKHAAFHQRMKDGFNAACLAVQAKPLPKGPTPIFVLGMPRSGSTLIEQMLASHSRIDGTMELPTLAHLERLMRIEGGRRFKKDFPESVNGFSEEELARFGQVYLEETAIYRGDADYFIDKMPPNFERIGMIHKILPQAIIIDARRYPVDCGFSAYKQHFASGHGYSYSLQDIGHYYNGYLDLMDYWDKQLPGKILTVQYEENISDTETVVRRMLDHIGVDYEPACLEFYKNKRAVKTASSEQVRQPINRKGVGIWTDIADDLQPMMDSLGAETLARFKAYSPL